MCMMKYVLVKKVYELTRFFTEYRNCIEDEYNPGRPTITRIHKILNFVNVLVLNDSIEDICEHLGISFGKAHNTVHDNYAFSNVCCLWVSMGHCKFSLCITNRVKH